MRVIWHQAIHAIQTVVGTQNRPRTQQGACAIARKAIGRAQAGRLGFGPPRHTAVCWGLVCVGGCCVFYLAAGPGGQVAGLRCGLRRRKRASRTGGSQAAVLAARGCLRCLYGTHVHGKARVISTSPWRTAGPPRLPPRALFGLPFPGGPAAPAGVAPGAPAHQQHRACACTPRAHAHARPAMQVALPAEFCPQPSQGRFYELEWPRPPGAAACP